MSADAIVHPTVNGASAVLFDVGGTLTHPDWQRLAELAKTADLTFDIGELQRAFYEALRDADSLAHLPPSPSRDMPQTGSLFISMYLSLGLAGELSPALLTQLQELHRTRHLWCGLDPEAPFVLSNLKAAGLQLGVISNTEDGRLDELLKLLQINEYFDCQIDSQVVGCRKPDATIFHLALESLGIKPQDAVYVGDSYRHDVVGAKAAGLHAILLDPLDFHRERNALRIRALSDLTPWR